MSFTNHERDVDLVKTIWLRGWGWRVSSRFSILNFGFPPAPSRNAQLSILKYVHAVDQEHVQAGGDIKVGENNTREYHPLEYHFSDFHGLCQRLLSTRSGFSASQLLMASETATTSDTFEVRIV